MKRIPVKKVEWKKYSDMVRRAGCRAKIVHVPSSNQNSKYCGLDLGSSVVIAWPYTDSHLAAYGTPNLFLER